MAQREWVEKDFYKELGVTSSATKDEIKRAARKILAENHPDRNPGNTAAEERYKAASEAKEVLTDDAKRKEYDETRRLFANGGFGRRSGGGAGGFGGFSSEPNSTSVTCSIRPARQVAPTSATCSADCSAAVPSSLGPAGRGGATTWRPTPSCPSWRRPRVWRCRCG